MALVDALLHYGSQGATIIIALYLAVVESRQNHMSENIKSLQRRVGTVEQALMGNRGEPPNEQ